MALKRRHLYALDALSSMIAAVMAEISYIREATDPEPVDEELLGDVDNLLSTARGKLDYLIGEADKRKKG